MKELIFATSNRGRFDCSAIAFKSKKRAFVKAPSHLLVRMMHFIQTLVDSPDTISVVVFVLGTVGSFEHTEILFPNLQELIFIKGGDFFIKRRFVKLAPALLVG